MKITSSLSLKHILHNIASDTFELFGAEHAFLAANVPTWLSFLRIEQC